MQDRVSSGCLASSGLFALWYREFVYIARGMGSSFPTLPALSPEHWLPPPCHTDIAKRKTPLTTEGTEGPVGLAGFSRCYYQSFLFSQGDGQRPALPGYSL